jgi:hypothetical protein
MGLRCQVLQGIEFAFRDGTMEIVGRLMAKNAMRHHIRENHVDFRPLAPIERGIHVGRRGDRGRIRPDRADGKFHLGRGRGRDNTSAEPMAARNRFRNFMDQSPNIDTIFRFYSGL